MICPCKNCKQKGCGIFHDQCEAYKVWSDDKVKKNQKRNADYDASYTRHPNKENALRKKMRWK